MATIACLHGAESNIAVFEEALSALADSQTRLIHRVESELLASAIAVGKVTGMIADAVRRIVQELCGQADAVLITCTTLGVVAKDACLFSKPVLRVDAVLAEAASRYEGNIVVLCSAPATLASTRELFSTFVADDRLSVALIPKAWDFFMQQDIAGYHRKIAAYARQYMHTSPGCIVLAQSSMTEAARQVDAEVPVLTVPRASLLAAIAASSLKKTE
ncbi:hypothetical protein EHW64_03080 [Erwinia psidii]|uniref:hypothetical protein n=1 Tax=Erwinia psidii TaxID=69224 RepID=UPI00226B0C0A|nr:hypothetical protein [Erwinia psidii]MCX8960188.1 hypothetical protein [Erwinia psidii]